MSNVCENKQPKDYSELANDLNNWVQMYANAASIDEASEKFKFYKQFLLDKYGSDYFAKKVINRHSTLRGVLNELGSDKFRKDISNQFSQFVKNNYNTGQRVYDYMSSKGYIYSEADKQYYWKKAQTYYEIRDDINSIQRNAQKFATQLGKNLSVAGNVANAIVPIVDIVGNCNTAQAAKNSFVAVSSNFITRGLLSFIPAVGPVAAMLGGALLSYPVSTGLGWLYDKAYKAFTGNEIPKGNQCTDNQPNISEAECTTSPLVIDLNKNGIQTFPLGISTRFDLDNSGFAERTGWLDEHDGLLVLDLNGNGKIDNGAELFGNHTALKDGTLASDGFAALHQYDENGDGIISSTDSIWSKLKVWRDKNMVVFQKVC